MLKSFLMIVTTIVLGGFFAVQAQNGFVVWAEGGGCERELKFNRLEDGKVGEKRTAVERGIAADIWVHISYDGVWIAFGRAVKEFKAKYGACDYHSFDLFDIYIAKIDNGRNLPAKAIKIGHGYWPSWGEDAKDPHLPKTLYYTDYQSQIILKTVISPDGSFTPPEKYYKVPEQEMGTVPHVQLSPDGKFILYRPNKIVVHSIELKKDICGSLGGCHPCWGPRSRFFVRSKDGAFLNLGTSVKKLGRAGVGDYWQGLSNDAYYDEGKLWVIGKVKGGGQNGAGSVEFREVDISNDGWKIGPTTQVGSGSTCDIHVYGPDGPPVGVGIFPLKKLNQGVNFNARVSAGAFGMQLIIESVEPACSSVLYDFLGQRKSFTGKTENAQTVIPLRNIVDGVYMLNVITKKGAAQKTIRIVR